MGDNIHGDAPAKGLPPRPWRLDGATIRDAEGGVVVSALNPAGMGARRLIVKAVNGLGGLPAGAEADPGGGIGGAETIADIAADLRARADRLDAAVGFPTVEGDNDRRLADRIEAAAKRLEPASALEGRAAKEAAR